MRKLFGYLTLLAILAVLWVGLYHTVKYFIPWLVLLDRF